MASSALQKLIRKSLSTRIVTSFHTSQGEPLALHYSPFVEVHQPIRPNPVTENLGSSCYNVIFPSFPFGFSSNPILLNGFPSLDAEDADFEGDEDDSGMVWSDSVKKKRKRKMNKHKYKKLRKRMRRQK